MHQSHFAGDDARNTSEGDILARHYDTWELVPIDPDSLDPNWTIVNMGGEHVLIQTARYLRMIAQDRKNKGQRP